MADQLMMLREGGVVGGGGAGFPTWKKLASPAEILMINGAECEPVLRSDQYLMLRHSEALVRAADALRGIVGASQAVIALKGHYARQADALTASIQAVGAPVSLHRLPAVYPIGDEQAVVHAVTGRVVPPQGLPGHVGCVVVSVSTALNALAAFSGIPVTRRLVTIAGEVATPGLYDVPVGLPVIRAIEVAGGAKRREYAVLLGGPMMGELLASPSEAVVTKTCGGILVLPMDHLLVQRARLPLEHMRNRAKAACIQCRYCTDLCPRYLLGHGMYPHRAMRAFGSDQVDETALLCMECGICEMFACPMNLSPRRVQQAMKAELRAKGASPDKALHPDYGTMRNGRQVPATRLAAQIGVAQYAFPLPEQAIVVEANFVSLPLKQHIGIPAQPVVKQGDHVRCGQRVAQMANGTLGADIHASIDGVVAAVTEVGIDLRGGA